MSEQAAEPLPREIRGIIIPVNGARLLLPNAVMAEVISSPTPVPVEDAPEWLVGLIPWRGRQVPLVNFAALAGLEEVQRTRSGSRAAVLKALGDDRKQSYLAVVSTGFPHLTSVSPDVLTAAKGGADAPARGIRQRVLIRDEEAIIPDLLGIQVAVGRIVKTASAT